MDSLNPVSPRLRRYYDSYSGCHTTITDMHVTFATI